MDILFIFSNPKMTSVTSVPVPSTLKVIVISKTIDEDDHGFTKYRISSKTPISMNTYVNENGEVLFGLTFYFDETSSIVCTQKHFKIITDEGNTRFFLWDKKLYEGMRSQDFIGEPEIDFLFQTVDDLPKLYNNMRLTKELIETIKTRI